MWGRADEHFGADGKGECYAPPLGPYPAGSGLLDRLELPPRTIVDLAGNLTEWARDELRADGTCTRPLGVLHDPVCAEVSIPRPASSDQRTYAAAGGSWPAGALDLAYGRFGGGLGGFIASFNGFRCTRPGL